MNCLFPFQFDVAGEGGIVAFGEVLPEVDAAGFFTLFGGVGHQERNGQHILTFPAEGITEDLVHHIPLPEADDFNGLIQRRLLAGDADVAPHKGAQGVADIVSIEKASIGGGNFQLHPVIADDPDGV